MNIPELVALQKKWGIEKHLVWCGPDYFTIAHTDEERNRKDEVPLESCKVHQHLAEGDGPPAGEGIFIVEVDDRGEYVWTQPIPGCSD